MKCPTYVRLNITSIIRQTPLQIYTRKTFKKFNEHKFRKNLLFNSGFFLIFIQPISNSMFLFIVLLTYYFFIYKFLSMLLNYFNKKTPVK